MKQKAQGIILHLFPLREHDVIVRLYTRELGRISAVAKGVKKQGSKLASVIQPGNEVELQLSHSKNSDLYLITGASVIGGGIFGCGYRYYNALCFCWQLMISSVSEGEANLNLYELNADIIAGAAQKAVSAEILELCFMIRLIRICGFFPELHSCIVCGNSKGKGFRISQGGIVCENCLSYDDVHFSEGKRILMEKLCTHNMNTPLGFEISEELCDFFRIFLKKYIKYHFELDMKL